MKLYTEKQLRQAIAQGYDWCHQKYMPSDNMIEIFIKQLTPIELPTDEEVTKKSLQYSQWFDLHKSFYKGAKWMLEYIIIKNR